MKGLIAWIVLFLALVPGVAGARDVALAPATCALGADSQAAALALPVSALDCSRGRFLQGERFVRLHADLPEPIAATEQLYWRVDPALFDSILLQLRWQDGSTSSLRIDPETAARNWTAPLYSAFALPAPPGGRLVAIDAVVERPRTLAVLRDAHIVDADTLSRNHYGASLIAMLTIGMLLVPVFHTLIFHRLLRAPFILWHAGMALSMAVFVLMHSGLIFAALPDFPLAWRWQLNSGAFVASIVCAAYFTTGLLEKGTLPPGWRRMILLALIPPVALKLLLLADLEAVRPYAGRFFAYSYAPLMIVLPAALIHALRRGSRAAGFTLFGFGGVAIGGAAIMIEISGLLLGQLGADVILRGSLVLMSLATSAAVADRFMVMRMQLDRERSRAARLGAMAYTDALTGLANRRAFDESAVLREGYGLIVADLDHFKRINDEGGHDAGDRVLVRVADTLRRVYEDCTQATTYRLGGEEFAAIVPADDPAELARHAEALRAAIEGDRGGEAALWALTASIGAAQGRNQALGDAFSEADEAMYRAKRQGRNRCNVPGISSAPAEDVPGDVWERVRSRI